MKYDFTIYGCSEFVDDYKNSDHRFAKITDQFGIKSGEIHAETVENCIKLALSEAEILGYTNFEKIESIFENTLIYKSSHQENFDGKREEDGPVKVEIFLKIFGEVN